MVEAIALLFCILPAVLFAGMCFGNAVELAWDWIVDVVGILTSPGYEPRYVQRQVAAKKKEIREFNHLTDHLINWHREWEREHPDLIPWPSFNVVCYGCVNATCEECTQEGEERHVIVSARELKKLRDRRDVHANVEYETQQLVTRTEKVSRLVDELYRRGDGYRVDDVKDAVVRLQSSVSFIRYSVTPEEYRKRGVNAPAMPDIGNDVDQNRCAWHPNAMHSGHYQAVYDGVGNVIRRDLVGVTCNQCSDKEVTWS